MDVISFACLHTHDHTTVETHQTNYQRIQDLRARTTKNDNQIKDTLRLLADTRKELMNASATEFPDGPNYKIQYDELLSYARRISKTTIPPVGALNAISTIADSTQQSKGETSATTETAATTPAGGTPNAAPTPQPMSMSMSTPVMNGNGTSSFDASQQTNNSTSLPEPLAAFLNPHSQYTFVPWPTEEQVRQGSVAALAYLAEQGVEVEGYDPEAEKARKEREEEERKQAEERERAEREEREHRFREEQARIRAERERVREEEEAERRRASSAAGGAGPSAASGAGPAPAPAPPKAQFQFMGDEDDDDDD